MYNNLTIRIAAIILASIALLYSCTGQKNLDSQSYKINTETEGKKLILQDQVEGFFDKLSNLEMSIQLKDTSTMSIEERTTKFEAFLASEVLAFDAADSIIISAVMDSAIFLVNKLNPDLIPRTIDLVKINTNHYGPSVYYTREDGIFIPKDALTRSNFDELFAVMLHEISHIVSRSDIKLKTALYNQIGFKKLDQEIEYPEVLKKRILINPDGVNDDFYIPVKSKDEGNMIKAVPIITSKRKKYTLSSPRFFDYLQFDLYALDDEYNVLCSQGGSSTLEMDKVTGFFEEIEDNTGYIIHPDEVIADNFMLLIQAIETGDRSKFSTEGKILLEDIEQVLRTYKRS